MNSYVIIGFLIALAVAAFGGAQVGAKLNDQAWEKREATANAEHAAKILAAEDAARVSEQAHALQLATISGEYESKLKENSDEKDAALAAVRSGARRLSIPAKCPPGGGSPSGVAAAPGGRDGEARAQLSEEASGFLIAEASRANAIVRQLTACQAVILGDRIVK